MFDIRDIRKGVIKMLEVNMGLQEGEKVLVLTDIPTTQEWKRKTHDELFASLERSLLAKAVSDIICEVRPGSTVTLYPYPSLGRSGAEPHPDVGDEMRTNDVVIAITTYSISHTDARLEACAAGTRVASMPRFQAEMFLPGGIMSADYEQVAAETRLVAEMLTRAKEAVIRSPLGTDLTLSLEGRESLCDTGLLRERGAFGNLPAGEAYIAPLEGKANGKLVAEKGWFPGDETIALIFRHGLVEDAQGGGEFGDELREALGLDQKPSEAQIARRNLAELGVGTNPFASPSGYRLEMEKIRNTAHIAIGDNAHFGGVVSTDLHWDFILPRVTLILDGREVIREGTWLVQA